MPSLDDREGPRYLAIAEAISSDIAAGRLAPGDRLPPQRELAQRLSLDFTTVARGYVEASKRGLVESVVGRGTFVRRAAMVRGEPAPGRSRADFAMNMPPEPEDPALIARMREGYASVAADLESLLRYQGFGGSPADRDAASAWLGRRALVPAQERIFVTPGAHPAMVGIFSLLAKAGETVLCEAITYPGVRSIAAQLGLQLVGIEMDQNGVIPEALEEGVRIHAPKAIYLNPTLQNPTTITIPERRRAEICTIARKHGVMIVEDDAYGFIQTHGPAPLAAIAPDACWHVAGLAKCIGAGLRTRLCYRAGRARGLVVQQRDACALRHGFANHGRRRHSLDHRWDRRHDPAFHPFRDDGERENRGDRARAWLLFVGPLEL